MFFSIKKTAFFSQGMFTDSLSHNKKVIIYLNNID
jgi:hypothetical protein